jgi:putative oxidoreductase
MLRYLFTGLGLPETALAINRVAVGLFFLLSGYHKLFDAQRHAALILTLRSAGLRHITVLQWLVPGAEFSGGLAVAIGLLSVPAALGLLILSIGATFSDGIKRIANWQPIDKADFLDDVLYLPEVLYALLLLSVILAGPGPYSLDALIAGYF